MREQGARDASGWPTARDDDRARQDHQSAAEELAKRSGGLDTAAMEQTTLEREGKVRTSLPFWPASSGLSSMT